MAVCAYTCAYAAGAQHAQGVRVCRRLSLSPSLASRMLRQQGGGIRMWVCGVVCRDYNVVLDLGAGHPAPPEARHSLRHRLQSHGPQFVCACVCVLCVCCSRQPFVLSPLSSLLSHLSPLASLSSLLSPLADGDDQAAGTDARTRGARRPSRRRRRSPQLVAASSQERGGGARAPSRRTQRTRGREAPRLGG
jgi:hypothetical protein